MPVWAYTLGEAVLAGLAVGYGSWEASHDLAGALIAGFGAAVAKALPSKATPTKASA